MAGGCCESAPDAIGRITLDVKQAGKRSAGNPHAAFDEAGAGNVIMGAGLRTNAKVVGFSTGPYRRRASPRPYRLGHRAHSARRQGRPARHPHDRVTVGGQRAHQVSAGGARAGGVHVLQQLRDGAMRRDTPLSKEVAFSDAYLKIPGAPDNYQLRVDIIDMIEYPRYWNRQIPNIGEVTQAFQTEMEKLLINTQSPEDTAANADKEISRLIAKGWQ